MSNALVQSVPVLDGSNWLTWEEAMSSYLMSQGQYWYLAEHQPTLPATNSAGYDDAVAKQETWIE